MFRSSNVYVLTVLIQHSIRYHEMLNAMPIKELVFWPPRIWFTFIKQTNSILNNDLINKSVCSID
jgi:hypothetical protein